MKTINKYPTNNMCWFAVLYIYVLTLTSTLTTTKKRVECFSSKYIVVFSSSFFFFWSDTDYASLFFTVNISTGYTVSTQTYLIFISI